MSRKVRLTRMIGRTGDVAFGLSTLHFSEFLSTDGWRPDVNLYRFDDRFEIWVDLAGVAKDSLHIDVLPDRVRLSGERCPPAPNRDGSNRCRQVICMEIESGRFGREIVLPAPIDRERVRAKQDNGLLWLVLPLASAGC